MTWINLPSVSVQSGSKTVTVSNAQTTHIKVGDALLIGNYQPVEISGVFATQLTLRENWSNATQTNVVAVVMPTSGDFVTATKVLKEAIDKTRSNFAAIEKWSTQMGTVEFKGQDNTTHIGRTFKQMDADVADLEAQASNLIINVSGRGFARSEADMLAMRAANATKFAASGFVHFGKHYQGLNVNEGLWTPANSPNECFIGRSSSNLAGTSDTDSAVINLAGFMVNLSLRADYGRFTVKFPTAPDGTVTYDSATGAVVKHPDAATAFASETATNKVVTERVDMFGLEMNLQTINDAQPFFAPYGCAQSQSTAVDGIATEVDNINPISYFAAYPGDTTSRGRGWNITKLSDAQKEKLFANPEHNVFRMNNGELKYAKVVQKTIPGAGNGDWENVNPATGNPLRFDANTPVLSPAGQPYVASKQWRGVFEDGTGYYLYVLGTVLRLNQGAYHPSFNPLGTGQFSRDLNNSEKVDQGVAWNNDSLRQELSPKTKADCFGPILKYDNLITKPSRYSHFSSGFYLSGSIASNRSGRPGGRFYDAIYPDDAGGVIDRRLSAFPITMEDYFKAMAKAENGTMRGMETLVWTDVLDAGWAVSSQISGGKRVLVYSSGSMPFKYLKDTVTPVKGYIVNKASGESRTIELASQTSTQWSIHLTGDAAWAFDSFVVLSQETNLSVSGKFLQTDVLGSPANIMQVDALKEGWMGSWLGAPNGAKRYKDFQLIRSIVDGLTLSSQPYTLDNGVTWQKIGIAISDATNFPTSDLIIQSNHVGVWSYTAAAKVTKPSLTKPVYGGRAGLGYVSASSWFGGTNNGIAPLAESLLGKILTSNSGWGDLAMSLSVLSSNIRGDNGKIHNVNKHEPIPLVAPLNDSPAIKVLPHAASINGQATLGFVWNELKHNGTNWGDDGTMLIIDNTGTYNNLNGEPCLYGYAELALPIGWVDNHARFGAQVPGVDL